MSKKRIVIIGTGNSVNNHLHAINHLTDRLELVAAVDINEERVQAFCSENNIPNAYTSVSDMLATEKPDIVSIVTPSATHKDLTIECLEARAWVYCEKPLCASLAEYDEIKSAEERTGKFVSTVFQWRFGSAVKHLKQMIDNGDLGKPMVAVCNTLWYRTQAYYDVPWRAKFSTAIGGPTITLGIHIMDLFLYLMSDWESIYAVTDILDHEIEVEDLSMAMVRFKSGARATVINSALSPRQETYLRLDFQKATAEVKSLYRASNEHWTFTATDDSPETQDLWDALDVDFSGSHHQQLGEILDAMESNQRPPVSGDEARRIIEFTASLYKSAASGQAVHPGEITPDDPFYYSNNPQEMAKA